MTEQQHKDFLNSYAKAARSLPVAVLEVRSPDLRTQTTIGGETGLSNSFQVGNVFVSAACYVTDSAGVMRLVISFYKLPSYSAVAPHCDPAEAWT